MVALMVDPIDTTFGQVCTERLFQEKAKAGARLDQAAMIRLIDIALEDWTKQKKAKQKPRKKPNTAIEEEWLNQLQNDPANKGVNVRLELSKMRLWATGNGLPATRKRFINWLLKADRSISMHSPGRLGVNLRPSEPQGWREWLNANLPESKYSRGGEFETTSWDGLSSDVQNHIKAQMK